MAHFINRVVSETEDISEVKQLALVINKIGSKFADASENYRNRLSNMERRIGVAEDTFETLVEKLMEAPPGSVNTRTLRIRQKMSSAPRAAPSTPATGGPTIGSSPATPPITPSGGGPNLSAPTPPSSGAPNLSAPTPPSGGAPNLSAAPAPSGGAPNLNAAPAPSGGGPNLNAAPAPSGGAPNLNAAPPAGPNVGGPSVGGPPGASSIADALAGLTKAPAQEASASSGSGGGINANSIQNALAGLKKAPPKEEKEESGGGFGAFGGFNPAEQLKKLKKAPVKEKEEEQKSEFASILEKRRQASDEDQGLASKEEEDEIPEEPVELSAEEMKSQLQDRLKQAFKT